MATDERADETTRPGPRARVKLWRRAPTSRPSWSIEVSEGATAEELGRLVRLAFAADQRIASAVTPPARKETPKA